MAMGGLRGDRRHRARLYGAQWVIAKKAAKRMCGLVVDRRTKKLGKARQANVAGDAGRNVVRTPKRAARSGMAKKMIRCARSLSAGDDDL